MASMDSTDCSSCSTSTSSRSSLILLESGFEQAPEETTEHKLPPWCNDEAVTPAAVLKFIYNLNDLSHDPDTNSQQEPNKSKNTGFGGFPPVQQLRGVEHGIWQDSPSSGCYASFGDQNMTATVGTFGQLLQFSGYLGAGSSGMFSVDHAMVPEPYLVKGRAEILHELSQQPFHCGRVYSDGLYEGLFRRLQHYGLRFPGLDMTPKMQPKLSWVHWRWPSHEYLPGSFPGNPDLKLTIQWMIRDRTLLQRCILENYGKQDYNIDLDFCKSMLIRDLDHLNPRYKFNEEGYGDHDARPGPGGYSWVCVHKLNPVAHVEGTAMKDPVQSTPTSTQSSNFETASHNSLQAPQDVAPSSASIPTEASHTGASTSFNVPNSGQQGGILLDPPLQDKGVLDHEPDTSTHPSTERIRKSKHNFNDREASSPNPYAICVISSVAIDGKVKKFGDSLSLQSWKLVVKGDALRKQTQPPSALEVTAAYKIELLENSKIDWEDYVIPYANMRVGKLLQEQQPERPVRICVPTATKDPTPDVEQGTGKNLSGGSMKASEDTNLPQHCKNDGRKCTQPPYPPFKPPIGTPGILPARPGRGVPQNHLEFAARRNLEHILSVCAVQVTTQSHQTTVASAPPAIALTCGDMSGHMISWSASFFAFQFLVECYNIISNEPNGQDHSLLGRIKETCLGHLRWLNSIRQQSSGQRFGSRYWVNGELIVKPDVKGSLAWLASQSFLDTVFQILKASLCMELWNDDNNKDSDEDTAAQLMSSWALPWLFVMEDRDERKKYAWPHAEKEDVNIYRLDEHVWIWRALKSLELDNHRAWHEMRNNPAVNVKEVERLRKRFASEVVQREVSSRFTTENTALRKRMLATTRSIRESRFMLHARDTALLHKGPSDFLGTSSSVMSLWKTTIQSQTYHTEFRETGWGKSLRFALNIMLGAEELNINNADELVRTGTDILFRSSSPNGLFPGRIEISTYKPVEASSIAEEDMASYYHASFEIPYILLTHMERVLRAYTPQELDIPKFRRHSDSIPGGYCPLKGSTPYDMSLVQGDSEQRKVLLHLTNVLLGRSEASDLDAHDVLRDVRWTMKKAVPFDRLVDSSKIVKLDDEWLYKYPDFFSKRKERKIHGGNEALDEHTKQNTENCIVDIGSSKRDQGKRTEVKSTYRKYENIENALDHARTAEESKKRLHSFSFVTKRLASRCSNTTEASEKANLEDFFHRHSHHAKHAFDRCIMIRNYWESEFHLSYYQLLGGPSGPQRHIASPDIKSFPAAPGKQIVRVSAGFRFVGDFFDRYWTCYVLHSTLKAPITKPERLEKRAYRQRKVLEQRLFADILKSLIESVGEILDEVYTRLDADRESESFRTQIQTTNAYLSWSTRWQKLEPLVQELHADLASSQTIVDEWETREDDRGEEKPRWTWNDERKYRSSITKMRRKIKRLTSQLKQLHETTKSLQDLCSVRLDTVRESLRFRSEQNIAKFTYVTVVFLPLGFTASIFSMSGSPEKSLVINMVVASIIALVITILTLMNVKGLADVGEIISTTFKDVTSEAKMSSVLIRDRILMEDKGGKSNTGDLNQPHLQIASKGALSSDLVFWTGFLFIELPSRIITASCRTLGWPRDDNKDLEGLKESERIGPFARSVVASGLRYCLVPSMTMLEMQAAAVLGRTSMEFPHEPVPQLVADDKLRKDGYATRIARVLLGLFTVPVFLPTWILQVVFFNACDALALLGELVRQGSKHISLPESDGSESSLMTHLTKVPDKLRPMKIFKNRLRSEKIPLQPGEEDLALALDKLSQAAR